MTAHEAHALADAHVSTLDSKGHSLVFVSAKPCSRYPGEWNVVYELFSPENTLIDGPIVVIVNEVTKEVHVMEGP